MSAIISLSECNDLLQFRLRQFKQKYPKAKVEIEEKEGLEFCYQVFDDEITHRLKWAKGTAGSFEDVVKKAFPWCDVENQDGIHGDFMVDVADVVMLHVQRALDEIIPDSTWKVVTTRRLTTSLVISIDQDWRILDWERIQREKVTQAICDRT